MKKYELMMIINPSLMEADRENLIQSIEHELIEYGAKILGNNHPGEQKLAYRIHGSHSGYYLLYTFEKEGDFTGVTKAFNIRKDIWRYMFTKEEE